MVKLNINLKDRGYPIFITNNYDELGKCLKGARLSGKVVLVTDTNVEKHQAEECMAQLAHSGIDVKKFVIQPGEASKNLKVVEELYRFLLEEKLDRSGILIALGGGVVGDLTGFVAATYMRGIHFVQIPTTLLAQADSSVGGKVGVDFMGSKNMIGAFYQPKMVYINVKSLQTLPERELKAGLAEVVKHGIIRDKDFFDYIDNNLNKILGLDDDVLQYMTKVNCSIKGRVVEEDEKEDDLRAILNFGHTVGHAIESVTDFRLLHGECVSLGMVSVFKLAAALDMVDKTSVVKVIELLSKIGLPVNLEALDVDKVYNQMFYDKKAKDGKLLFVLPRHIGEVVQVRLDEEELIRKAISNLVAG